MISAELKRQVSDFIDQDQFESAIDSINSAAYGEIKLDEAQVLKLYTYLYDYDDGISFENACSLWWALPSSPRIGKETGQITAIGELAHSLHRALLGKLKWIGMEKALGYELKFDVAVPPTVVLALATEYATAAGVRVP